MKSSIEQKPLLLPLQLARKIGRNAALVLQQIHYWLQKSKHLVNGVRWIYNSFRIWAEQLPLSKRTIQRAIAELKALQLIKVERRAAQEWDQTNWYTIDYEKLEALVSPGAPICPDRPRQVDAIEDANLTTSYTETSTEELITTDEPTHPPVVKKNEQTEEMKDKGQARLAEVVELGVQKCQPLILVLQRVEEQVFRRALDALKEAISRNRAANPTGYLIQALRERWGPTEETTPSAPAGFQEWFNLAYKAKLVTHSMVWDDGVLRVLTNEEQWEDWGFMAATFPIAYCRQMLGLD